LLTEEASRERRSLAQQALAVLARGLRVEVDAKARRRAVIEAIHTGSRAPAGRLSDPAKLIREDRRR
jgi:hypothetical protein